MSVTLAWKLLGSAGIGLFSCRWLVQMHASRRAGRSVMTRRFWLISLAGSVLLLCYFVLGPERDLVGAAGNVFPAGVALYNLSLRRT